MDARSARITHVRSYVCDTGHGRNFLFVVVDTDAGIFGVGEGSQNDQDEAVVANVRQLTPYYVGRSVFDLIERRGARLRSERTGRAWFVATSALEQAVWDAIGKAAGLPVYQLLGGSCRDNLRCYATMGAGLPDHTPDTLAAEAARLTAAGYSGVKAQVVHGDEPVDAGVERVRVIREAVGDGTDVMAECAFRFDRNTAEQFAARIVPYACAWIEAPLRWDDATNLAALRASITQRVASGETLHGRRSFTSIIEGRAVDILQPDVKWTGGILEAKKIAAWAETYQIDVAPHNNSGPVATAASAHLCATLPNFFALETPSRAPEWQEDLVRGTHVVRGGSVSMAELAKRPGLGIDFDESVAMRVALTTRPS